MFPENHHASTSTATTATAPLVDTTMIPISNRTRTISIEGMEKLSSPPSQDPDNYMTESERRMKEEELSFYSASGNDHGDDNIWGLLSGVGGNIYEW